MNLNFLNTLPAAVYTAILLFVIKELLEAKRRRRTDANKLKVYKKVLAYECERNHWFIKSVVSMSNTVEKRPNAYSVETDPSGRQVFTKYDPTGEKHGGSPLPKIHTATLEKMAVEVAYVDESLAEKVADAHAAALELEHIRASIIDNVKPWDKLENDGYFASFWRYVQEEADDAKKEFEKLYFACTGNELKSHRLR